MNAALRSLECIRDAAHDTGDDPFTGCATCSDRGEWSNLRTRYDLELVMPRLLGDLDRDTGMWRYRSLLPTEPSTPDLLAGGTPLIDAPRLAEQIGVARIWIKDESRNPTWSFKDRAAALAAAHAVEMASPGVVVASTGNAAAAIAAAARRAGIPSVVLVASGVDPIMEALTRSFGAYTLATPTKKDRWRIMEHAVAEWGLYPGCNYTDPPVGTHPFMADGYKTTGFEIFEQVGGAPDWVFAPLGHADNLYGIHRAFDELVGLGLSDARPRLGGGEVFGSLVDALANGRSVPRQQSTDRGTVATSIATPQSTFQAYLAITESDGFATVVEDDEIIAAHRLIADSEGVLCELSSATGVAALRRAVADGVVESSSSVVFVATSGGTKSLAVAPGLAGTGRPHAAHETPPLVHDSAEAAAALRSRWGFDPR